MMAPLRTFVTFAASAVFGRVALQTNHVPTKNELSGL